MITPCSIWEVAERFLPRFALLIAQSCIRGVRIQWVVNGGWMDVKLDCYCEVGLAGYCSGMDD
jgi:hypothetical protein